MTTYAELPESEKIQVIMRALGVDEEEARFIRAFEKGETKGDVVNADPETGYLPAGWVPPSPATPLPNDAPNSLTDRPDADPDMLKKPLES